MVACRYGISLRSTRLRSLVSHRVKHSKRNSISMCAHVLFPIYAVQQHLKINAGIIKMVCEPLNKCKTGISSKGGCKYEFSCIEKDNIPTNCDIIKSSDVSKRLTNDEKTMNQNKSWEMATKRLRMCKMWQKDENIIIIRNANNIVN